jgi:hypothetical protein|tara:strand:- start:261 stop:374 length:114 start_codon:yes stop_codon:yes gene_type:complete
MLHASRSGGSGVEEFGKLEGDAQVTPASLRIAFDAVA